MTCVILSCRCRSDITSNNFANAVAATDGAGGERAVPATVKQVGAGAAVVATQPVTVEQLLASPSEPPIVIDKLAVAAGSGDQAALATAFADTGKACGACHEKFRAKAN